MSPAEPAPVEPDGKRAAMLAGALTVFARDGYARAGVDAIAAAAGVSTRTLYKHFGDKARLFAAVVVDSSARTAATQIAVVDRHLGEVPRGPAELEAALLAFGRDWTRPDPGQAAHYALTRHLVADAEHLAPETAVAWQEAGPVRFRRALADRLRACADRGLLRTGDPGRAAYHLLLLVSATGATAATTGPPTEEEREAAVVSGVRAFLHGHLP